MPDCSITGALERASTTQTKHTVRAFSKEPDKKQQTHTDRSKHPLTQIHILTSPTRFNTTSRALFTWPVSFPKDSLKT